MAYTTKEIRINKYRALSELIERAEQGIQELMRTSSPKEMDALMNARDHNTIVQASVMRAERTYTASH